MTTVLDRPSSHAAPEPVAPPSRLAGWRGRWRVALRLARRDAWRGKGRALLVILLIALPVAAATGVVVFGESVREVNGSRHSALLSLGTAADARIMISSAPVVQAVTAWDTSDGRSGKPIATVAAIEAALPAGSRAVSTGGQSSVVLESGPWGVQGVVSLQDTRDPLNAGRWTVLEGRLPESSGEVALAEDTLARLQARIGSTVVVTATQGASSVARLTVVGSVARTDTSSGADAVALQAALPADAGASSDTNELLVDSPQPWTWSDVRRVNAVGGIVLARAVLESPPPFCDLDSRCVDSGIDPTFEVGAPSQVALAEAARIAALLVVALVLIVLQVALLAGPAFAVQLRRRQRELGLLGASGADAATLRRTVLASGLVLGTVGGVLGLVVGWALVWLLGGALPFAPLEQGGRPLGVPSLPAYTVGIALIGVISATAAALVPAVIAGRGEVLDTLRGRRPLPAVRTRTPVLGVVLGLAGIGLLVYGRTTLDALTLGAGIVLAELGLVLVMPWLVVRTSALGRFLPLTPRLALRDAGRHRLRTSMAACAIAAAAAAAVATSTWQTSQTVQVESAGRPYLEGTVQMQVAGSWVDGVTQPDLAVQRAAAQGVIDSVAPGSPTVALRDVTTTEASPQDETLGAYGAVTCVQPQGTEPPRDDDGAGSLQPCGTVMSSTSDGRTVTTYPSFGISAAVAMIEDPRSLGVLLGPLVPVDDAVAALERGEAVVTLPGVRDAHGRVWLRPEPVTIDATGSWNQAIRPPVTVPAVEASGGATPAAVIVGPAAFAPGGALAKVAKPHPFSSLLILSPSVQDRPDRPTVVDQLSIGMAKARIQGNAQTWTGVDAGSSDTLGLVLAAASVGTLLMALLAGLMVTALAMADARADLVTLAAVGAAPGVRRRMAAASAGTVAALGCAAGVLSGLVVAKLLVGLFYATGGRAFEIRWWLVVFVLVVIPIITAGVAWVTTRSRVLIPRRGDS